MPKLSKYEACDQFSAQDGQYVVIALAITDAQGAYSFAEVPTGDYRVRRLAQPGTGSALTTPASYPVKVTGDSKAKTLDFGKPGQRGSQLAPRVQPGQNVAVEDVVPLQQSAFAEELDRVFQDWHPDDCPLDLLDAHDGDGGATAWGLGLLSLMPLALVSMGHNRRGGAVHIPKPPQNSVVAG